MGTDGRLVRLRVLLVRSTLVPSRRTPLTRSVQMARAGGWFLPRSAGQDAPVRIGAQLARQDSQALLAWSSHGRHQERTGRYRERIQVGVSQSPLMLKWRLMRVIRAVTDIDWQDKDIVLSELLTPEQHCKYKYLGHVEGPSPPSLLPSSYL